MANSTQTSLDATARDFDQTAWMPCSLVKPTNPHAWSVVDDKLYLNLSKGVQKKWRKDRDAAIVRADANWPKVLTACDVNDNCDG